MTLQEFNHQLLILSYITRLVAVAVSRHFGELIRNKAPNFYMLWKLILSWVLIFQINFVSMLFIDVSLTFYDANHTSCFILLKSNYSGFTLIFI
jgi:hypothetical protein